MTTHILNNEGKSLANLLKKVEQLNQFNRIFAQYLDPNIAAHCKIANLQNNCLIVIVENGSWATQLRFLIPDLIVKLNQHPHLQMVKAICCKTRPDPNLEKSNNKRRNKVKMQLSAVAAKHILKSASLIKDKKLREILEKIARRGEIL